MFETGAGAIFFGVCVCTYPRGSMYGLYTYIYHTDQPNVGKYTIHGSYGYVCVCFFCVRVIKTRGHIWVEVCLLIVIHDGLV